jgi:hypothetical protein
MISQDASIGYNVSKSSKPSEDAYAFNESQGLAAISDGVSNSFFPQIWSKLLVNTFCQTKSEDLEDLFSLRNVDEWLKPIQERWLDDVKNLLIRHDVDPEISNRIPLKDPAAATFVGVQFIGGTKGKRWRALIVGDSVLMQVRAGKLVGSYLINHTNQFSQFTQTLASYPGKSKPITVVKGERQPDDQFILATDAMAKWILQLHETSSQAFSRAIDLFIGIHSPGQFDEFVHRQQQDRKRPIEWDDASILMILPQRIEIPILETTVQDEQIPEEKAPVESPAPASRSPWVALRQKLTSFLTNTENSFKKLIKIVNCKRLIVWGSILTLIIITLLVFLFFNETLPIVIKPTMTPTFPIVETNTPRSTIQPTRFPTVTTTITPTITATLTMTPSFTSTETVRPSSTSFITVNQGLTLTIEETSTKTVTSTPVGTASFIKTGSTTSIPTSSRLIGQ